MNITFGSNAQIGKTGSSGLGTLSGVNKAESDETKQSTGTNSDSAVIKAANFDKVDLSESAMQYLEEEAGSDSDNTDNYSETDTAAETSVSETVSQISDDDVLASELYSYTETELQELMLNGTITRSEYETELAKRSGENVSE